MKRLLFLLSLVIMYNVLCAQTTIVQNLQVKTATGAPPEQVLPTNGGLAYLDATGMLKKSTIASLLGKKVDSIQKLNDSTIRAITIFGTYDLTFNTATSSRVGLMIGSDKSYLDSLHLGLIRGHVSLINSGAGQRIGYNSAQGDSLVIKNINGSGGISVTTQADSSLLIQFTGSTGSGSVKKIITQTSHGFTVSTPIYVGGGGWAKADTTNFAMGVVDSVINANTFEVCFAGAYNSTGHGLTVGSYYYVTMPAGATSTTSPNKSQPVFVPIDANTIEVLLYRPNNFGALGGITSVPPLDSVLAHGAISSRAMTIGGLTASSGTFSGALSSNSIVSGTAQFTGLSSGPATDSAATVDASGNLHSRSAQFIDMTGATSGLVPFYNGTTFALKPQLRWLHTLFTPTTGNTITLINNQYNVVNPAGSLTALTVTLPSSPTNGDIVYIKFTQAVTTVTYAGGTLGNASAPTTLTAGATIILTYDSTNTTWY